MRKIKFVALMSILLCLLIVIPYGFAVDNDAANETVASADSEILSDDVYFDSNSANSGNGSVDNPYGDFTNDKIKNNSVIHFASGEYNLSNDSYCSDVSFYGEDSQNTILNGNGYTLYGTKNLVFKNITLLNIKIVTDNQFASLSATNTVFKDSGDENSKGGAIYSQYSGSITLTNCSFYNNFASYGGAIYMSKGSICIYNSTFEDNSAIYGGAIFVNENLLEIYNSTFKNNVALMSGGAITSSYRSTLIINNDSSFYKNKASFEGGAIYSIYASSSIFKSSFENNSAAAGGALFIDNSTSVNISGNEFKNNSASMAGAIYSLVNSVSTIINNVYSGNSAIFTNDLLQTDMPYLFIGDGNYDMYLYNSSYTGELPSSYNLKDYNLTTPVKNQGSGGNCWSFSAMAALESAILKATGITYDLSEENMKNLMSWYSDYGWNMEPNKGGYDDMAVGYLVSWLGPVFESQDSYNPQSALSLILNSFAHIQNVAYLTRSSYTDNDLIKKAILDYGAVSSSIRWNGASVKSNTRYYNGNDGADHAVAIVGWDDNFSKNNFGTTPPGDGAWIIKNSHSNSSGNQGYWYVSYYDVRLAQPGKKDTTYVFIFNDTLKFDKNYQYDIPGKSDFFYNSSSTVWYKNLFNATGNEYLAAVSTFFNGDTNYTISISVNGELKLTQSGFSKEGYWTINLKEFIPLKIGDIFEVAFKITVNGDAGVPISEKYKTKDGEWINNFNNYFVKEGISFVSYDGKNWKDFYNLPWKYASHNYLSQVACIKAFTVFDTINTTTKLSIINITNGYNVKATVLNQYNRPVTSGSVTFSIDGKNYTVEVNNGIAVFNVLADVGNYDVSAVFNAVGHISSKNSISLNISSLINTSTSLTVLNEYDLVQIIANVTNQYGYSVNAGRVTFTVEGNDIDVDVIDGIAKLTYYFNKLGFNNISAKFNSIYYYTLSNAFSNVTVKSTIISNDATKTFNSKYSFTLLDSYGNPLNKKAVNVTIGSKNYEATTDENGVVIIAITLNPGKYSVKITNPINNESKTQTINVVKRITENKAVTMFYGAGKYYKVRAFDDNGNVAKGVKVTFKINGKSYTRLTDSNGYASFMISQNPGKYTITAEYNGFKVSNVITVKTTIITKNINVKKGKAIKFTAKLLDKNGKIIKNKKITFKLKGKTYKVKTNKKGVATLKVTKKFKVGKYTITSTYGKLTVKNTIKIKK